MLLSEIQRIPYPESLEKLKTDFGAYVRLSPKYMFILVEQLAGFAAHKCDRISSTHDSPKTFKIEYFGFPEAPQRDLFEGLPTHNGQVNKDCIYNPFLALFCAANTCIQYHGDGVEVTYAQGEVTNERQIPVLVGRVTATVNF